MTNFSFLPVLILSARRALLPAAAIAALIATTVLPEPAMAQVQHLKTTDIYAGVYRISAEVARTTEEQETGLMNRRHMADNAGMIFKFDKPTGICMWMKNTQIPLSVAFIDASGTILNIEEMKEETLDPHCAQGGATYALEMNKAWFSKRNIKAGSKLTNLP